MEKQKQYFSSGIVFVLQAFFVSFLLFGTVDFVSSIYGFFKQFYGLSLVDIRFDGSNTFAAVFFSSLHAALIR